MEEAVYKKNNNFQNISSGVSESLAALGNFLLDFKK